MSDKKVAKFNGLKVTRVGDAIFIPLPREAWRKILGGCSCRYCSDTERVVAPGFWDTLVVRAKPDTDPDHATTCHYPELHGAKARRR